MEHVPAEGVLESSWRPVGREEIRAGSKVSVGHDRRRSPADDRCRAGLRHAALASSPLPDVDVVTGLF